MGSTTNSCSSKHITKSLKILGTEFVYKNNILETCYCLLDFELIWTHFVWFLPSNCKGRGLFRSFKMEKNAHMESRSSYIPNQTNKNIKK